MNTLKELFYCIFLKAHTWTLEVWKESSSEAIVCKYCKKIHSVNKIGWK